MSCVLHFLFHRDTHTEVHSAACFIHPCIHSVFTLCITLSCILHSVYCTQGQRHAHSEAAISQTALQETWLNLPPPRLPSVSLMTMMVIGDDVFLDLLSLRRWWWWSMIADAIWWYWRLWDIMTCSHFQNDNWSTAWRKSFLATGDLLSTTSTKSPWVRIFTLPTLFCLVLTTHRI